MNQARELVAEAHYKKTGWVPTEWAVMNFFAGFDACVELAKKSAHEIPRINEIKDSLDMGWFCDNPNGNDIKEEIQFLLDLISLQKERIRELENERSKNENRGS